MSYTSISRCAADQALYARVNACISQEQLAKNEPLDFTIASMMVWAVASASDVEAAYESALTAQHGNPGGDPAVISDAMILANVQANWPTTPT